MSEWWGALPADRSRPSRLCLMVLTERTSSVHSTHERLLAITGGEGFASSMVVVISLCTHILNHCVGHFYRNHSIQPKKKKRWGSQSYQGGSGSCTKGWDHPTASPSTPPSPLFCLAEILAFKSLGALIEIQSPESLGSENQGNHIFNKCPQWSLGKQKFENHCAKYIIQTLIHGFETCLPGYTTNS